MKILLDTATLLWICSDPDKLSLVHLCLGNVDAFFEHLIGDEDGSSTHATAETFSESALATNPLCIQNLP